MDYKKKEQELIYAMDIGTHSITGVAGKVEDGRLLVVGMESEEYRERVMIDGQIENIAEVAALAGRIREQMEKKLGCRLERVYVAAAGRALKTQKASFELELADRDIIGEETVNRLEAGAIAEAERMFRQEVGEDERRFFLVGYSVIQYYLDHYLMSDLLDHHGQNIRADIVATFLPEEVVESLYTAMNRAGMQVAGVTLEPIAAINAAIPKKLRLLNLALVDIGAGTSDIAVCRDGSVFGYTMVTTAGDEITEALMQAYLLDFDTAEEVKLRLSRLRSGEAVAFCDILGNEQELQAEEILDCIRPEREQLCAQIAQRILEVNGKVPSAVFLAGGGSQLPGLKEDLAEKLGLEGKKVAVAGNFYEMQADSEEYDLHSPEFATPLGIAVSAGLNLIHDNFKVQLNERQVSLFGNGLMTMRDLLLMNGYRYQDMVGRSGRSLIVTLEGERKIFNGSAAEPALLEVNGRPAALTDNVRAGDVISFQPAKSGADAVAKLADLKELAPESRVLVNGRPAGPDTLLATGDVITAAETPGQMEYAQAGIQQNGPETMAAGIRQYGPETMVPSGTTGQQGRPDGEVEQQENPSLTETVIASLRGEKKECHFLLNERPLILPEKPDEEPYYLMDMLEYTGMDFENVKGPVILEVNGRTAGFRTALQENDQVTVREEQG